MAISRRVFFDGVDGKGGVRHEPFAGRLSQTQVDNLNLFLDTWERLGWQNLNWLAFLMGSALHETAHTFAPIEEYGKGRGRYYGRPDTQTGKTYYGRGFSQLTLKDNYRKASQDPDIQAAFPGLDLVNNPGRALDPRVSVFIHFDALKEGWYTGKKMADYLGPEGPTAPSPDFRNAYRILNPGAFTEFPRVPQKVADYSGAFLADIRAAHQADPDPDDTAPLPDVGDKPELELDDVARALAKLHRARGVSIEFHFIDPPT